MFGREYMNYQVIILSRVDESSKRRSFSYWELIQSSHPTVVRKIIMEVDIVQRILMNLADLEADVIDNWDNKSRRFI